MASEKNYSNYKNGPDDEIDLGELILNVSNIIKKNAKLILVLIIIGLVIGLAFYFISGRTYRSSMVLSSGMLTGANGSSLINTLDRLIVEKNYDLLSQKLALSEEQVKLLGNIEVSSISAEDDESITENIFRINVEVSNNDVLDSLEYGIIHYLENNTYVKRRIGIKRENLEALIGKISHEMQEIDSLKEDVTENIIANAEGMSFVMVDPVNIYREGIALFQQELDLQRELALVDNIQVIESFTRFESPVSPRVRHILMGPLVGFILSIILIFLKETNNFLKRRQKSMKTPA